MAKRVEFEITVDNIDLVKNATTEAISIALEAVGLQAEGDAKMKCPVDTGYLRNSITHAVAGNETSIRDYKSNNIHADTKATRKAGTAGKSVAVREGSYSGTVGTDGEMAVYIGSNVEYAPYVEYGTSHSEAQPFLRPAIEGNIREYEEIFTEQLERLSGI